jgi:Glu-tRNA(Gln) amidotransferase subunit E-like FAD-binding protein
MRGGVKAIREGDLRQVLRLLDTGEISTSKAAEMLSELAENRTLNGICEAAEEWCLKQESAERAMYKVLYELNNRGKLLFFNR